ncbi:MFS transporter [Opitutus sp. ER46]|uniref:MFS transporter n=1 Tax=Opitutus sp. ER46 TaxID=2161864 RepID=UPI000D311B73|nr:MFS transporter [Opitutus sp. ER46]PTX98425.1 hypothetical protein DB354_03915 [Opitutus sp. ER46]
MIVTCKPQIPPRWIGFMILPWASFAFNFAVVNAAFIFSLKKFVDNPAGLTFILSLPGLLAIVIAPLSSFLSDRIWTRFGRRKPFVVTASTCMIVALVAMPLATSFGWLVAAYVLYHLGDGLSAPRDPLKQEVVPPHERGRATGAMYWCQNLATVVFYSVMLGRFDDVRFFAGIPLHGEEMIYWSAALLLLVMLLLITLGIRELDQKSPLVGQKLSLGNFVRGLLDRELWPVYLLVLSFGLLNFFSGFGPFLSTLLYTEQWNYTKQEMGMNVAIGGVLNVFIIGALTFLADRLPRMRAFKLFIWLILGWNVFYFCYVNFVLPDKRPSLIEIIAFGEVLSILSLLLSLVYTPLIYDYVRRNKMGTFAAGAQIATRGTQLITLNGVGLFVWAYAVLFQPPAGEMTRVVLREETSASALVAELRASPWTRPSDAQPAPIKAVNAQAWQADGVVPNQSRTWEIRLQDKASAALADTRKDKERERARRATDLATLRRRPTGSAAEVAAAEQAVGALATEIAHIDEELAKRAEAWREQVASRLGDRLIAEGEQITGVAVKPAVVVELAARERPERVTLERLAQEVRLAFPLLDLRPLKRASGYGIAASALVEGDAEAAARRLQEVVVRAARARTPELIGEGDPWLGFEETSAFRLELAVVEEPVSTYVSPVTRVVNTVLSWFGHEPDPARRLEALARALRVAEETPHVRVTAEPDARRLAVTALFDDGATQVTAVDAVARRLAQLLGNAAEAQRLGRARAFVDRVEKAAAAQRLTVVHPFLASAYVPMRFDYMSGYLWVFLVAVIGIALTLYFCRLERRGVIRKRGVEEAETS